MFLPVPWLFVVVVVFLLLFYFVLFFILLLDTLDKVSQYCH